LQSRLTRAGLADIADRLEAGVRLDLADGVRLFDSKDLLAVGWLANRERERRHAGRTFFNHNIRLEATNVCVASCLFCAFARLRPGDPGAYTMSLEDAWDKLRKRSHQPITEVHVVNGLHPGLPFDYYTELLRGFKRIRPDIHLKCFTAVEIAFFADLYGMTDERVLRELMAAGLDSLTQTGMILGTVGYLAPEQAQSRPVTPATDQYALGVVAFEALTGTRPFGRDSPTAEAAAHVYELAPSARAQNPALPIAVDSVFDRALAKRPEDRFANCSAFAAALRSACTAEAGAVTRRIEPVIRRDPVTQVRRRRRRAPVLVATGATMALLAGAVVAALVGTDGPAAKPRATPAVTRTTVPAHAAKKTVVKAPSDSGGQTSADASDLNTQGYRLLLAGNYAAALPLLQQAVAGLTDPANPVTAYANFNLGQTLVRLSRCSEAVPYLQRALQLEPASQQVAAAIGYAHQCAGALAAPPTGARFTPGHGGNPNRRAGHRRHTTDRD